MAKLKGSAFWREGMEKSGWLDKAVLPIAFLDTKKEREKVKEFLKRISAWSATHAEPPEMEYSVTIYYRDATAKQRRTAWALYEIMANVMNGGMKGLDMVKPMDLYRDNLREWNDPVLEEIRAPRGNLRYIRQDYRVVDFLTHREGPDYYIDTESLEGRECLKSIPPDQIITLAGYRGMSQMDKKTLASHIDGIFNQLGSLGADVGCTDDIPRYWAEIQWWKDKHRLNSIQPCTRAEYRESHPFCERCGGLPKHLAHIKAVGMGNDRSEEKLIDPANTLHLCVRCHIGLQHQKGWDAFFKDAGHLENKVKSALKK